MSTQGPVLNYLGGISTRSAAVMEQHDKSPISTVRGIDSSALPQAAAFFNVSELFNSFHSVMTEFSVQYSTSLSDTRHL